MSGVRIPPPLLCDLDDHCRGGSNSDWYFEGTVFPQWISGEYPQAVASLKARLSDAEMTLEPLRGLVILDEIQRRPELFPVLRVLADRRPIRTRFLVR